MIKTFRVDSDKSTIEALEWLLILPKSFLPWAIPFGSSPKEFPFFVAFSKGSPPVLRILGQRSRFVLQIVIVASEFLLSKLYRATAHRRLQPLPPPLVASRRHCCCRYRQSPIATTGRWSPVFGCRSPPVAAARCPPPLVTARRLSPAATDHRPPNVCWPPPPVTDRRCRATVGSRRSMSTNKK